MNLLYIDLFCGAGGTSTGVNTARLNGNQCAEVIACVNHDANAIASHAANHPEALHFTEDIRTLDLNLLSSHVDACKKKYPEALIVLWASLECTNFSKAKGGQPRDADSRTLAEYLFRYIEAIDPDYIQIENVEEFMSWGDVDDEVPESAYAQVDRVYEKKTNLGGVLIRFSSLESMTAGNITHESVHAADCILDYVGAKTDVINDEYLAYLAGWIADCCDKVKEKEINRQKMK